MEQHIFKTAEEVLVSLADLIVRTSKESIDRSGRFNFVLSGGSSPKKLFELLASPAYRDRIAWQHVFFFFGDERYVPLDHQDSNFLMAKQSLFVPLGITEEQLFPVNTSLTPDQAAYDYEERIRKHFDQQEVRFDLILLGLGDDAHTASLFPHTDVLSEKEALVKNVYVEKVKMDRITFTAPLINAAQCVAFLVYGAGKAEAVKHVLHDAQNVTEYPAQLIKPLAGRLHWFLDEAAARAITS